MKNIRYDLSSQIALEQIEERLYHPLNAYDEQVLTGKERIRTNIYPTPKEAAEVIANVLAMEIKSHATQGKHYVLSISGGRSPEPVLKALVEKHQKGELSFANVHIIPMYEYYPLTNADKGVLAQLRESFLNHVDIDEERIHAFDIKVSKEEVADAIVKYNKTIEQLGGIDCLISGIGCRSSIGMNSPGTVSTTETHLSILDSVSKKEAITIFNTLENVPAAAITLGLKGVMDAKKVVLLAWGGEKASMLRKVVEERHTEMIPASFLQLHEEAQIYTDLAAGAELTRIHHPWLVTSTLKWTNKLIRRAIVWLCEQTGKPILKLTNQDYSDHQLGSLLSEYGSAYDVNIKVFNNIQHTITGWPGGKPNADDSQRPERAEPAKKRVIIFSPHPDDDVISMGGTFHRLVEQGHDVHVAYQTSGNIAVGDEEVIRYLSLMMNLSNREGFEGNPLAKEAEEIKHFLMHEKQEGSIESPEVRRIKGAIRQEEARTACRYVGLKDDHVHFLNLPFYETGAIKKGDLTEADVQIIIDLLQSIQPHQIFVAGDLADPHGTHKVCLNAAFAAIDQIKDEAWMKDCWIWMYRGAWAEWEIDHIEMAVPMSPEQLRFKRNSILKHQSQMESAPFLGDDERLFWQRSEDRNRATAKLYQDLGLASYEAIEAFVRYHPID